MTQKIKFQLYALGTNRLVGGTGGVVQVNEDGEPEKIAITDINGTAATNPRALTQGSCELYVADSVSQVDLYIQCPGGQWMTVADVVPGEHLFYVDVNQRNQTMVIPFSHSDSTDAVEKDTGFTVPVGALLLSDASVKVVDADSTETVDFGTMGTSNDPDGFLALAPLTTAGLIKGTIANGTPTLGALLFVQDSANSGDEAREGDVTAQAAADAISYTTTSGTDSGAGFFFLSYVLMGAAS